MESLLHCKGEWKLAGTDVPPRHAPSLHFALTQQRSQMSGIIFDLVMRFLSVSKLQAILWLEIAHVQMFLSCLPE